MIPFHGPFPPGKYKPGIDMAPGYYVRCIGWGLDSSGKVSGSSSGWAADEAPDGPTAPENASTASALYTIWETETHKATILTGTWDFPYQMRTEVRDTDYLVEVHGPWPIIWCGDVRPEQNGLSPNWKNFYINKFAWKSLSNFSAVMPNGAVNADESRFKLSSGDWAYANAGGTLAPYGGSGRSGPLRIKLPSGGWYGRTNYGDKRLFWAHSPGQLKLSAGTYYSQEIGTFWQVADQYNDIGDYTWSDFYWVGNERVERRNFTCRAEHSVWIDTAGAVAWYDLKAYGTVDLDHVQSAIDFYGAENVTDHYLVFRVACWSSYHDSTTIDTSYQHHNRPEYSDDTHLRVAKLYLANNPVDYLSQYDPELREGDEDAGNLLSVTGEGAKEGLLITAPTEMGWDPSVRYDSGYYETGTATYSAYTYHKYRIPPSASGHLDYMLEVEDIPPINPVPPRQLQFYDSRCEATVDVFLYLEIENQPYHGVVSESGIFSYLSTLTDDFLVADTEKWSETGTVIVGGGKAELGLEGWVTPGTLITVDEYNLDVAQLRIIAPGTSIHMRIEDMKHEVLSGDIRDYLLFSVNGDIVTVNWQYYDDGEKVTGGESTSAFTFAQHQYIKIARFPKFVLWLISADGVEWISIKKLEDFPRDIFKQVRLTLSGQELATLDDFNIFVTKPLLSTFTDNFSTIDSTKWNSTGQVASVGGAVQLGLEDWVTPGIITSAEAYQFDIAQIKLVDASKSCSLRIDDMDTDAPRDYFWIGVQEHAIQEPGGDNLALFVDAAWSYNYGDDADNITGLLLYNPETHKYFRIVRQGSSVALLIGPDGINWELLKQLRNVSINVFQRVQVVVYGLGQATFDNFNI